MEKQPAFQFYVGDWRKDPGLQVCSKTAKGVWVDMMCLMFEGHERGFLTLNGRAMTKTEIAFAVGGDMLENATAIEELLEKGVASQDERGAIFNRRMVRDEQTRRKAAEAGKLGADHGKKGAEFGRLGGRPRKEITPGKTPGGGGYEGGFKTGGETGRKPPSSSSSSPSGSKETPPTPPAGGRGVSSKRDRGKRNRTSETPKQVLDHFEATFRDKTGEDLRWPRDGDERIAPLLERFQAAGVMALWDKYLELDGTAKQFRLGGFVNRVEDLALDGGYKVQMRQYENGLTPDEAMKKLAAEVPGVAAVSRLMVVPKTNGETAKEKTWNSS